MQQDWWCPEKGAIKKFQTKSSKNMALMTIKNNVMPAKIAQDVSFFCRS